jgi:hypothetical protein
MNAVFFPFRLGNGINSQSFIFSLFRSRFKVNMTTRPLSFHAHVCKPTLYEKVNNDEVVDEIKGLAYDFKHGHGFTQPDSNATTSDQVVPESTEGRGSTTVQTPNLNIPLSIKHFQEGVRDYINTHQLWCEDTELSYIYKTYFNPPYTRFNLINLAGDVILTKASLERNVNDHFAKIWFEGMMEIILECLCIE